MVTSPLLLVEQEKEKEKKERKKQTNTGKLVSPPLSHDAIALPLAPENSEDDMRTEPVS